MYIVYTDLCEDLYLEKKKALWEPRNGNYVN